MLSILPGAGDRKMNKREILSLDTLIRKIEIYSNHWHTVSYELWLRYEKYRKFHSCLKLAVFKINSILDLRYFSSGIFFSFFN